MKWISFYIICFCTTQAVFGQWQNTFSSSIELEDWEGDISTFRINEDNELQLNDTDAGEVLIWRTNTINFDSLTISFDHLLDFSPSDNNQSTIYLMLSESDINTASGYFIQIGENGSDDALDFYYLSNGVEELIASGTMGAMANMPAQVKIVIDIYDGLWSIQASYDGISSPILDLEFMDNRFLPSNSEYFAIRCEYSSSRADKFYYDDMSMIKAVPDVIPPSITNIEATSANEVIVYFDEPVDELSISNTKFNLNNGIGVPESASISNALSTSVYLDFGTNTFDSSIEYTLSVENISDLKGNSSTEEQVSFFYARSPQKGEVLLSEILSDPYSEGEDFIELYNQSENNIQLEGLSILNIQNGESKEISNLILGPKSYVALSEDIEFLIQEYKPSPEARLEYNELPAMNNDDGYVQIVSQGGEVLDSFEYSSDLHFDLIDETEGVSLERINYNIDGNNGENWTSASKTVRFATPGYENSVNISTGTSDEEFYLASKSFSPNQDGDKDQMVLLYELEKNGFIANVDIYDASGHRIRRLTTNNLLATSGQLRWDGINDEGSIAEVGIYIITGELFHPDGDTKSFKKAIVLADFLD